jgi:pSer/pThr/pTyr-binding forkhead associated (FHA) protein
MAHKFLRVGRGDKNKDGLKNDIQLTHESISRSHLEVFIDEEGNVFITDLDTKNGTFVNGHPIVGDTKLNHGDILKLGVGRPVHWEKWIHLNTTDGDENTEASEEIENPNQHHLTTAAPLEDEKKKKYLLLIFIVVLLLIGCFLYFNKNIIAETGLRKGENILYTKTDLEAKTFGELEELSAKKPEVFLNEDKIISRDNKEVFLTIIDNKLIEVKTLNEQTESPNSTSVIPPPSDTVAKVDVKKKESPTVITDNDADGIVNANDNCPDESGPASNRGCPIKDSDNDGVWDQYDNCPDEFGPASNNGCPIPPPPPPPQSSKQHYTIRTGSQTGTYQIQIGASDESAILLRDRIKNNANQNCNYPSDPEEIIELNKNKLSSYQYRYGILPAREWIDYKCY